MGNVNYMAIWSDVDKEQRTKDKKYLLIADTISNMVCFGNYALPTSPTNPTPIPPSTAIRAIWQQSFVFFHYALTYAVLSYYVEWPQARMLKSFLSGWRLDPRSS